MLKDAEHCRGILGWVYGDGILLLTVVLDEGNMLIVEKVYIRYIYKMLIWIVARFGKQIGLSGTYNESKGKSEHPL